MNCADVMLKIIHHKTNKTNKYYIITVKTFAKISQKMWPQKLLSIFGACPAEAGRAFRFNAGSPLPPAIFAMRGFHFNPSRRAKAGCC